MSTIRTAGAAGLPRRVATWTWLERTEVGRMAFLLVAPPAPVPWGDTAGDVERRMLRPAAALELDGPDRPLVYVGPRLALGADRDRVSVRLDERGLGLRARVCAEWAAFARGGGPVALLVGLDPLAPAATPEDVEEYLRTRAARGRLRMGNTAAV
ncbi:hypothetical protein [Streptomyces macrosporus]|uniref:Uncharacterized protein n=1 Tax=Streptomyces macrosporus TaxID=44032 RepID=A0ABN3JZ12_9ACTN